MLLFSNLTAAWLGLMLLHASPPAASSAPTPTARTRAVSGSPHGPGAASGTGSVAARAADSGTSATPPATRPRQLERRTVESSSDGTVVELHVAAGMPTTVVLPRPARGGRAFLGADPSALFPPQVDGATVVLLPKRDLDEGELASLTVPLEGGTVVAFRLSTAPTTADLTVTVREPEAGPQGPTVTAQLADARAELDECREGTSQQGVEKLAALILHKDQTAAAAFTAERHPIHRLDTQSRVRVEAKAVFRLFDLTFLVLHLENRDPARAWLFGSAQVALRGPNGRSQDGRVLAATHEFTALAAGEGGDVVLALSLPARGAADTVRVVLADKAAERRVVLDEVPL